MAKNSSFGFFVWVLGVGKKPNVLFVRWLSYIFLSIYSQSFLFFSIGHNVRRYVQLAQSRGGACFCIRGAMQDYAVITLFSRWQKP
ncbi:MAG: hypothetical protein GXX85_07515 [Ignavibacteria bacterium]|nr:hypothetical protein [Ignavibacteria bacterium]